MRQYIPFDPQVHTDKALQLYTWRGQGDGKGTFTLGPQLVTFSNEIAALRPEFFFVKEKDTPTTRKGGPGSGHHGHRGRPGKRGGSLPGISMPEGGILIPEGRLSIAGSPVPGHLIPPLDIEPQEWSRLVDEWQTYDFDALVERALNQDPEVHTLALIADDALQGLSRYYSEAPLLILGGGATAPWSLEARLRESVQERGDIPEEAYEFFIEDYGEYTRPRVRGSGTAMIMGRLRDALQRYPKTRYVEWTSTREAIPFHTLWSGQGPDFLEGRSFEDLSSEEREEFYERELFPFTLRVEKARPIAESYFGVALKSTTPFTPFTPNWERVLEEEDRLGGIPLTQPTQTILTRKGGPGSGHFGHAGRPGKRGGSLPGAGGIADAILGMDIAVPGYGEPGYVWPPVPSAEGARKLAQIQNAHTHALNTLTRKQIRKELQGPLTSVYKLDPEYEWVESVVPQEGEATLSVTPSGLIVVQKMGYPRPPNAFAGGEAMAGREEAFSTLAEHLLWNKYVPQTVYSAEDNSSRQIFIVNAESILPEQADFKGLREGFVMDRLANSADRHEYNLITRAGQIFLIDNEHSFPIGEPIMTHADYFHGWGPDDLIDPILRTSERQKLSGLLGSAPAFGPELNYLVGKDAANDFWNRVEQATLNNELDMPDLWKFLPED